MAPSNTNGSTGGPISVLFVCLGNICRSPMAEAVFRAQIAAAPSSIKSSVDNIDSAGTGAYHAGDSPDSRTMDVLRQNRITNYKHAARKVRAEDFYEFDYLLGMDEDNVNNLRSIKARLAKTKGADSETPTAKVALFGDYGGKRGEEVIDPYYGANTGFTTAYEQMVRFSQGFIAAELDET